MPSMCRTALSPAGVVAIPNAQPSALRSVMLKTKATGVVGAAGWASSSRPSASAKDRGAAEDFVDSGTGKGGTSGNLGGPSPGGASVLEPSLSDAGAAGVVSKLRCGEAEPGVPEAEVLDPSGHFSFLMAGGASMWFAS